MPRGETAFSSSVTSPSLCRGSDQGRRCRMTSSPSESASSLAMLLRISSTCTLSGRRRSRPNPFSADVGPLASCVPLLRRAAAWTPRPKVAKRSKRDATLEPHSMMTFGPSGRARRQDAAFRPLDAEQRYPFARLQRIRLDVDEAALDSEPTPERPFLPAPQHPDGRPTSHAVGFTNLANGRHSSLNGWTRRTQEPSQQVQAILRLRGPLPTQSSGMSERSPLREVMHSYASSSAMVGSSWFAELTGKGSEISCFPRTWPPGLPARFPLVLTPISRCSARRRFSGHAWLLFRGLRAELAAAARAALSDRGSPLLPGREVRHHLLDVLHSPAGPGVRAAYQSMGGLACSWRSFPGLWRL